MGFHYNTKDDASDYLSWFDLEKYSQLNNYSYFDWYQALGNRVLFYSMFYWEDEDNTKFILEDGTNFLENEINQILDNPDNIKFKHKIDIEGILRNLDISDLRFLTEENFKKYDLFDSFKTLEEWLDIEGIDLDSRPIESESFGKSKKALIIDVGADRELLEKEFSKWLTQQRKQLENNRMKPKREIENLLKYRVLQYIDIILWQKMKRVELTDAYIANVLFSDDYTKDVNTLSRQTKPLAKQVLKRWNYLDWLQQVAVSNNN